MLTEACGLSEEQCGAWLKVLLDLRDPRVRIKKPLRAWENTLLAATQVSLEPALYTIDTTAYSLGTDWLKDQGFTFMLATEEALKQ